MSVFSHIFVGSNDLARSKTFYDALFAAMGGPAGHVIEAQARIVYPYKGSNFLVAKPIDGQPATISNGGTVGFGLDNEAQVDAWYAAGVAAGGTGIEDAPGLRPSGLYLAYLRDPDGNKLCALFKPA